MFILLSKLPEKITLYSEGGEPLATNIRADFVFNIFKDTALEEGVKFKNRVPLVKALPDCFKEVAE